MKKDIATSLSTLILIIEMKGFAIKVNDSYIRKTFKIFLVWKYNTVMQKKFIMLGMVVGSFAGSYIPLLWGDSAFSMTSMFFGILGGIVGIWAGFKVAEWL